MAEYKPKSSDIEVVVNQLAEAVSSSIDHNVDGCEQCVDKLASALNAYDALVGVDKGLDPTKRLTARYAADPHMKRLMVRGAKDLVFALECQDFPTVDTILRYLMRELL